MLGQHICPCCASITQPTVVQIYDMFCQCTYLCCASIDQHCCVTKLNPLLCKDKTCCVPVCVVPASPNPVVSPNPTHRCAKVACKARRALRCLRWYLVVFVPCSRSCTGLLGCTRTYSRIMNLSIKLATIISREG